MSAETEVILKIGKREKTLLYLTTTPTRQLNLPYTNNGKDLYKPFTKELYNTIIEYYEDSIVEVKDYIDALDFFTEEILENKIYNINETIDKISEIHEDIINSKHELKYLKEQKRNVTKIKKWLILSKIFKCITLKYYRD